MLTLQKTDDTAIISAAISERGIEDLLAREWLLTNNRGGYSSSTIIGCNTRRYHALLIGSLNPPVNRIMALSNCLEMVICDGKVLNLSTFEFDNNFAPVGFAFLKQFRQDTGVHFDYKLDGLELTKSIYLLHDADMVGLVYDFTSVDKNTEFVLRPFIGLRDFHSLQKSYAPLKAYFVKQNKRYEIRDAKYKPGDGLLVRHDTPNSCELLLRCRSMDFETDQQWWFNFIYRQDKQRGQDFTEDLWTPGFFKCRIDSPTKIVLWANLRSGKTAKHPITRLYSGPNINIEAVCKNLQKSRKNIKHKAKSASHQNAEPDTRFEILCAAAGQFVTKRQTGHIQRNTILAGFPWFADWGRDTFISLPGLLLSTGRYDEAKSVLTTFADAADEGMIPNRFDDHSNTAYFNSIDASLWFINAAFQYLQASGDFKVFTKRLVPTIQWIIDSYHNGTRFDTHSDVDGLITSGNDETQLTWMDAKYQGHCFTPRYGKAVEINALWYNSLRQLAQFYADQKSEAAEHYNSMADKVKTGFCELFWNESKGYLNDCVFPDGSIDDSLQPNQIFAVSLPYSALSEQQKKAVVDVVEKELLTSYGLRTLATGDSRYKGAYTGPQSQRDEAYHQGTVWPYLIGPFVEGFLKVNDSSPKSKEQAAGFIEPLLQHLTKDGCLGQICEIFDGNTPHKPRGCIAQAWSVAELLRAYLLVNT